MLHDLELYKEFYETGLVRADAHWELILSDDPETIQRLETLLKTTQDEAVDEFIETSCWSDDLTDFVGKKGTPNERRITLCRAYLKDRVSTQTDYARLTPLEHEFYMLVYEMESRCTDPVLKKRAKAALKDSSRVAERATVRHRKEHRALVEKFRR